MSSKFFNGALALVVCLAFTPALSAQFLTEAFDYADGDLEAVSGGNWVRHSPTDGPGPPDIQVVNGQALIAAPGNQDDNRQIGSIMGTDDIWYYALRFSVGANDGDVTLGTDYFIHFKDDTTFNFNARLAIVPPADSANDFSFQIWASSEGDGVADWDGDFVYDEEIVVVVCWNNGTGEATLWINPVDMGSTSVSDIEEEDSMRLVEAVALRQDSSCCSLVTISVLSVGDNFDDVLAAVSSTGGDCPSGFERGDVNQDGSIDLLDVTPFVDALSTGSTQCEADVNGDGSVDLLDVDPFVALLAGG